MIALMAATVAAHVVAFPSGFYGWLTMINSNGSKPVTGGVKRTADEANQGANAAPESVAVDAKVRAKKRPALANNTHAQINNDSDLEDYDHFKPNASALPKNPVVSKQREQEVVMQMRSEREREHIKLLCDLAANQDLGLEVTDAAKQLVLEFLKKPTDEDIDLEALRLTIKA